MWILKPFLTTLTRFIMRPINCAFTPAMDMYVPTAVFPPDLEAPSGNESENESGDAPNDPRSTTKIRTPRRSSAKQKYDPEMDIIIGKKASYFLFFSLIIVKMILSVCILVIDTEDGKECLTEGKKCQRPVYGGLGGLEFVVFFSISAANFVIGCLIYREFPNITVGYIENFMKFCSSLYVVEVITTGLVYLNVTLTPQVIILSMLVVIIEGLAINMSFCCAYIVKYTALTKKAKRGDIPCDENANSSSPPPNSNNPDSVNYVWMYSP